MRGPERQVAGRTATKRTLRIEPSSLPRTNVRSWSRQRFTSGLRPHCTPSALRREVESQGRGEVGGGTVPGWPDLANGWIAPAPRGSVGGRGAEVGARVVTFGGPTCYFVSVERRDRVPVSLPHDAGGGGSRTRGGHRRVAGLRAPGGGSLLRPARRRRRRPAPPAPARSG